MSPDLESRVRAFVVRATSARVEKVSLDATLFADLGVDGDDGLELIDAFGKEFDVDISTFDHGKHFGPEAGGCGCPFLLALFQYFRSPKRDGHAAAVVEPISVRDLVEAAHEGRWLK